MKKDEHLLDTLGLEFWAQASKLACNYVQGLPGQKDSEQRSLSAMVDQNGRVRLSAP